MRCATARSLYANVFRPSEAGRYPVVVSFDVYGKDSIHVAAAMPAGGAHTLGQYDASLYAAWEAPDPGFWVPNGYVVVKAAARGTSGSKGRISPMSQMEAEDFHDVIEWCGTQPWSSGAVVTNGVSYLAMAQWRVGQLNPPHLKAMIPWEGVSDLYREWAFHGGIPETRFLPVPRLADQEDLAGLRTRRARGRPEGAPVSRRSIGGRGTAISPTFECRSMSAPAGLRKGCTTAARSRDTGRHRRPTSGSRSTAERNGKSYFSREALERQLRFCDYFLKGYRQ